MSKTKYQSSPPENVALKKYQRILRMTKNKSCHEKIKASILLEIGLLLFRTLETRCRSNPITSKIHDQ